MELTWITLAVAVLAYLLLQAWLKKDRKHRKLPPGPKGLPILGHLHLLSKNPYLDLQKLAEKHGPIMSMRFGFVSNIIVSSPQAAEKFLKTYDHNFSSRPPLEAARYFFYEQKNLTFASYGPYWRDMRKLCTMELVSNLKINSFQAMRKEELGLLINFIEQAAREHVAVDLSAQILSLIGNMTSRMIFGKRLKEKEVGQRGFKDWIQEGPQPAASFNLGDYFPYLGVIDIQGMTKKLKALGRLYDEYMEKVLEEHAQPKEGVETKDFVDTMLGIMRSGEAEFQFDRSHVKALLLDIFAATMDTTFTAIEWILTELIRHPRVIKEVQKELEQVVGMDRMVEESDLESLKYLDMVIKESFRLHPTAPLLLPHECIQDCTIDGFFIPKKSRVIVNVYAIGRDPKVWTDPETFLPERFVGSNIDFRGRNFELLPFGSGRRGCPGIQLAITVVHLVVAQLVHCFAWELPSGMHPSELDMSEEFGLAVGRAKHLFAIPTCRLHKR